MSTAEKASSITEAQKWCAEARKLLSKQIGRRAAGKLDLVKNAGKVGANLQKLKKKFSDNEAYQRLEREYLEIAGRIHADAEGQDLVQAELDAKRLNLLKAQTDLMIKDSKTNQKNLEKARSELQETAKNAFPKAKEHWEEQHRLADEALKALQDLHTQAGVFNSHAELFYGERANGREACADEELTGQQDLIAKLDRIAASSEKLAARKTAIDRTAVAVAQAKKDCTDKQMACQKAVVSLEGKYAEVAKDFRRQYQLVTDNLDGSFNYHLSATEFTELKQEADARYQALQALEPSLTNFEKAYRKAFDKIHVAAVKRVDEGGSVEFHIDQAKSVADECRQAVDLLIQPDEIGDGTPAKIAKMQEILATVDKCLELAVEHSKGAKKSLTEDVAAMKTWTKTHMGAKAAFAEILNLPGSDQQRTQLSAALLKGEGHAKTGHYVNAVKEIEGYQTILAEARKVSAELLKEGLFPDVQQAVDQALQAAERYKSVGPDYQSQANFDQIASLTGQAKLDIKNATDIPAARDKASTTLVELATAIENEYQALNKSCETAQALSKTFDEVLEELEKNQAPLGIYEDMRYWGKSAQQGEMEDRNWPGAVTRLQSAVNTLEPLSKEFATFAKKWSSIQDKFNEIRLFLRPLNDWPQITEARSKLYGDMRTVESLLNDDLDFAGCEREYTALKIEEQYQQIKDAKDLVPSGQLDKFMKELSAAHKTISDRDTEFTLGSLLNLENTLPPDVLEPAATYLHVEREGIWDAWIEYRSQLSNKTGVDLDGLTSAKATALQKYDALAEKIAEIKSSKAKHAEFITRAKNEDAQKNVDRLPDRIRALLDELETRGVDVAGQRTTWGDITGKDSLTEQDRKDLASLYEDLAKQLKEQDEAQEKRVEEVKDFLKSEVKALKKAKGKHKDYQAYHDKLVSQSGDIAEMIASGDPDLLEIAIEQAAELRKNVASFLNDDKFAARYAEVGKVIKILSNDCGDALVMKRLPDTYKRNYSDLQNAIVLARQSSPAEALSLLQDERLVSPIAAAKRKAAEVDQLHEAFKIRKKELETKWSDVKKHTKTRTTDKTSAVGNYVSARLKEADATRQTEDGITKANEILDAIDTMLSPLLEETNSDKARIALQDLDAKYAKEQREVRDLARQFEAELNAFKYVTLKTARGKLSGEEADMAQLNGLTKVVDTAAKMVQPYLYTISDLPHRKAMADKAPNLDDAKSKFQNARNQIANAEQTCQRLMNATINTNVKITADFSKVQQVWQEQTRQYSKEIQNLIDAVKKVEDKIGKDAAPAITILEKIKGQFRASAFAGPFAVLEQPMAKKKKDREKQKKDRLAAREEALRTMRELRTDILNHPVLLMLTSQDQNQVSAAEMMAATGYLRAALKRVEIESLIGV